MSVSSFLSTFADRAQSAINQTSLAGHVPGASTDQFSPNQSHRSVTLEALQHQIRSIGQQYASTTPIQKIITAEKGVAIDCDVFARDAKAQSKELYTWGQTQMEDLKDVTDRLAYLNFVHASLATSQAIAFDNARAPLKAVRDAESALTTKHNLCVSLRNQIARIEHNNQEKGMGRKLAELSQQLAKAEEIEESLEKEIEILKRKAIRESETMKWDALRELGEKLVLLWQASKPIIGALPAIPPSRSSPYSGSQTTGAARAALQRALDHYKPGNVSLPAQSGVHLSRSETLSFGESHATELSTSGANGGHPGLPLTPPPQLPVTEARDAAHISPIDPSALNQTPAPIGEGEGVIRCPTPISMDKEGVAPVSIPAGVPTVAESGVPVSAGVCGPGPASGSLRDIHGASESAGPRSGGLPGKSSIDELYGQSRETESAGDEKKRLEREERERVVVGGGTCSGGGGGEEGEEKGRGEWEGNGGEEEGLPAYEEIQE